MDANGFLSFINGLMDAFLSIGDFLNQPLFNIGDIVVSPLGLFTLTGLTVFITVAFAKWVVS